MKFLVENSTKVFKPLKILQLQFCVFCTRTRNNLQLGLLKWRSELWLMNPGSRSSGSSKVGQLAECSGQVAGRIFNGLAAPNKAKGHWQKKNDEKLATFIQFFVEVAAAYANHKSCTLIKGHTHMQDNNCGCCRCWPGDLINCWPKGLAVKNCNSARLLTSYPCELLAVWPPALHSPAAPLALVILLSIVAQLSTANQCNLQLYFCKFTPGKLTRTSRPCWQPGQQQNHQLLNRICGRGSPCPSTFDLKSCSCVCNVILF